MSTLPQKAPGSLSQAYQLLELVAISGEMPANQLDRLAGGTSYKENVVKSLKRQRLLSNISQSSFSRYRKIKDEDHDSIDEMEKVFE